MSLLYKHPPKRSPEVYKSYVQDLRVLENRQNTGFRNGKFYPYDSVEGGAQTIASGHKIKEGEDFSQGLTREEAKALLQTDFEEHKYRASKQYDKMTSTKGAFAKLEPWKKVLLTDYTFNVKGGLKTFPDLVTAVSQNDKAGIVSNYERVGVGVRNKWMAGLIYNNTTKL